MEEIFTNITKLGWAAIGSVLTLIAYIILEKFKSKQSLFSFTKTYNPIGTSINDNFFGNIKIIYNDERPVQHLNFVNLKIQNKSNRDFEDVILKCWVDSASNILSANAFHNQYLTTIGLEENHEETRRQKIAQIDNYNLTMDPNLPQPLVISENYKYVLKNFVWRIPAWNRNDSVVFNFLIENTQGNIPLLMHPIEKKSVKLIESKTAEEINLQRGKGALLYGYLIYIFSISIILSQSSIGKSDVIIFGIIGGLYLWIGLFLYQIVGYVKSFFN
ncbi:hypothetical protein GCM10007415_31510 [Parapedobacter pyrenivorans]|uniref:Uncharacterized protein n=1 Tax=Parapedobacter pyrenivorans TaxID=1305674 RepID=A0A917HX89_9SPHI|nr:hypothetical protein [Parapedobacter pyrenivorans]GGG94143.1 hypothetical protein GCM10007415_31510 [Parapedobacter pyrenivorans]